MLFRFTAPLALLVALTGFAGCSGGSAKVGTANFSCSGGDANALCLFNCSLGCSTTGCLRSDIAQNENLILQFSHDVDPATVNSSTIRLRTAAGELPVGEFFVNGNQVEFVPTVLVSGGQTFFGFRPNETYTLTIPGRNLTSTAGVSETVRSTSGFAFDKEFTCSLIASQGIQDLNGVPPEATLVSPSLNQLGAAPLDTIIRLDFNEMIDVTPFQSGRPVTFDVRRTTVVSGERICDSASDPITLPGTPRVDFDAGRRVSVLTFQPAEPLPPNVCIEINVTSAVVDLSGKPAQPQTFLFETLERELAEDDITENFANEDFLDRNLSGGSWSGGTATFAMIGGDGRHGSFSPTLGTYRGLIGGKDTYVIDTDLTQIPALNTLANVNVAVTDGRYFFDEMVVPGNVRITFEGSMPPVITVAGRIDIRGEVDIRGETLAYPTSTVAPIGQVGGEGGIFGGNGGNGGDRCLGAGSSPAFQGRPGESAHVLGGRAYAATTAGTGGQGSTLFPPAGTNAALFFAPGTVTYTPSASAGGGGGGLWEPGEPGRVTHNNHVDPGTGVAPRLDVMGPPAAGGSAVQFFPFPAASGSSKSSLHFLVGGSGGGSAASNAALALSVAPGWAAGCGGGGGGGAAALRAGDVLSVGGPPRF